MTQKQLIRDYLQSHDGITRAEALRIGIGNLPARINELRADGDKIMTLKIQAVNQYGKKISYGMYRAVRS